MSSFQPLAKLDGRQVVKVSGNGATHDEDRLVFWGGNRQQDRKQVAKRTIAQAKPYLISEKCGGCCMEI